MIDRRQFLQRACVGTAATGVAWAAPSITRHDVAFAGASCRQQNTLDWSTYTAGSSFTSVVFPAAGGFPPLTVSLSVTAVGSPSPATGNTTVASGPFGGQNANYWRLAMQNNASNEGYNATFTFSAPVYNLRFSLFDIDRAQYYRSFGFQDVVWLTGASFTSSLPGSAPVVTGAGTAGNPWTGTGQVAVDDSSNNGNVNVVMANASTFTVNYRSGNLTAFPQYLGISNLQFCR